MDKAISLIEKHYEGEYELFPFGSRVYGTERTDSDYDYIAVLNSNKYPEIGSTLEEGEVTVHLHTRRDFTKMIERHDVRAMECIYLVGGEKPEIDLGNLRKAFSTVANGAWIKGKKKLIVSADYNKMQAIKSIFHSIRIFDYGIQIVTNGNISEPARYKWLLVELHLLANQYERDELWEKIFDKYHTIYKDVASQFKILAPKIKTRSDGTKSKEDVLEWLNIQISKAEALKPVTEDLHRKIGLGGQARAYKMAMNYIATHLIEL